MMYILRGSLAEQSFGSIHSNAFTAVTEVASFLTRQLKALGVVFLGHGREGGNLSRVLRKLRPRTDQSGSIKNHQLGAFDCVSRPAPST